MVAVLLLASYAVKVTGSLTPAWVVGTALAWLSFRDWRCGLLAGVVYLEVGSWISLWLSPALPPYFFKDLFFLYPAYLGFLFGRSRRTGVRLFPWLPAGVFAAIVALECLNPSLGAPLIGLLGVKIWLGYVPLFFLGADLFSTRNELRVWLWTVLAATLPASLYGLYQFNLGMSGDLAEGTRPGEFAGGYVATGFDSGNFRLSSLFPSSTQFDYHLFFALFVGAALLVLERRHLARWLALGLLALIAIDVGLTGTRKLYLIVPSAILWFLLLEKKRTRQIQGALIFAAAGVLVSAVLGAVLLLRVHTIESVYDNRFEFAQTSFFDAVQRSPMGLGSGMASGPARYLDPERLFVETLPAKAVVELGILGLVSLILFYGSVAMAGFWSVKRCRDDEDLRSTALLLAIYLAALMITSVYGWPMDLDPANVDSWLSAGIVAGMPWLARRERASAADGSQPALSALRPLRQRTPSIGRT
jgi:hypothetical protein